MHRVEPIPDHLHTVTPRLVVGDGRAAVEFYRRAFAARLLGEIFSAPDGPVVHAEVLIGDSVVMITEEAGDGASGAAVSAIMATYWPDVDAAWRRALDAGAEVIFPLADHFYGERGGRLRDPFGQQWMLSQRIELLSAEQISARMAELAG